MEEICSKYPQPLAASTAAMEKQAKAARVKIDLILSLTKLHFTASFAVRVGPTLLVDPMVGN